MVSLVPMLLSCFLVSLNYCVGEKEPSFLISCPTLFPPDFSVVLNVRPRESVTEMDHGEQRVPVCFSAQLNRTLNRNATFMFPLSNVSTASLGTDFSLLPYISIPAGFIGEFYQCIDFLVFGDLIVEYDEFIIFDIVPVYELDRVYPNDYLSINIIDDDGMYIECTFTVSVARVSSRKDHRPPGHKATARGVERESCHVEREAKF